MTDEFKIRVIQKVATINGEKKKTRYGLEQYLNGQWTEVPVLEIPEDDQKIIALHQELADRPWWK